LARATQMSFALPLIESHDSFATLYSAAMPARKAS
jgi:hypothetical protein